MDALVLAATTEMVGLPPVTAPGAALPLQWRVQDGALVETTCVFWDTVSRAYDRNYRYRTDLQRNRTPGTFFATIDVPVGASTLYLRPYAVVDGEIIWGPREYTAATWRAMDAGSPTARYDASGRWWDADADYIHRWFGLEGGVASYVNQPIGGTTEDWLYQRQRVGVSRAKYMLGEGVASMQAVVELYFAELGGATAGQRVFDVVLEPGTPDEVVISRVDVAQAVGVFQALMISRTVTVRDYMLDVAFNPVMGSPILNGIAVRGVSAVPQRETSQRIAFPDYDTYVVGTGNYRAADLVLLGGADRHHGGLRFFELQVPQGAHINHAELRVTSAYTYYQALNLTIYGDAVDNSPDFASGPLVPNRPRTTASAPWNVTDYWPAGRQVSSPQLKAVIQEVVNRPGWRERNALSLLLIAGAAAQPGLPPRAVWAIEGSYPERAELIIRYTPKDQLPPTPAPTLTYTPIPTNTPTPSVTPTATPTLTPSATPTRPPLYLPLMLKAFVKPE
jgi:hypothetical protein